MIGTWINVGAILVGSTTGLLSGRRIPGQMGRFVTAVIGLVTLIVGVKLAIGTCNLLVLLLSLLIGGAVGTWLNIEVKLTRLGEVFERLFPRFASGSVPQGFVTASLLFCVGPMAILGALRDGLYGDWQLLGLKSVLDGVSSMILAAGLGPGVFFSALVVLVYQGGISLVARAFSGPAAVSTLSHSPALTELDAVGGAILIALSLKLLDLCDLKVGNLLPALALAPLMAFLFSLVGS